MANAIIDGNQAASDSLSGRAAKKRVFRQPVILARWRNEIRGLDISGNKQVLSGPIPPRAALVIYLTKSYPAWRA